MAKPKLSPEASQFISTHIRRHRRKLRMPQRQAVAVAYSEARERGYKVPRKPVAVGVLD